MDTSAATTPPHTQALLLLCARLGERDAARPLTPSEYNTLATWLHGEGMRPEDLLAPDGEQAAAASGVLKDGDARLPALLRRGVELGFAADRWAREGIWVIGRGEDAYPPGLRARLGRHAPVLLFGIGAPAALGAPAVAVVGSRDADADGIAFARLLGARCAEAGWVLVSGGARGVDQEAMTAAIDAGGAALGVLPEGVAKPSRSRLYRDAIAAGALTLVSALAPEARWSTGNAMARNKQGYAFSRAAVVVSSGTDGGTWTGACENLKHGWAPLWVRDGRGVPAGNAALLDEGGHPLVASRLRAPDVLEQLASASAAGGPRRSAARGDGQPSGRDGPPSPTLFDAVASPPPHPAQVSEPRPAYPSDVAAPPARAGENADAFRAVWPLIRSLLDTPHTEREVAERLSLLPAQARVWLTRARDEGLAETRGHPTRFVARRA